MDPAIIIIIFFIVILVWINIIGRWAAKTAPPPPPPTKRNLDNLAINQVIPIENVSPINDSYLVCQFDQNNFVQINHTEGLAVWGNFSESEYLSVFIENSDRQVIGKITNLELERHVCVIFTGNQSITTSFRQKLSNLYDLKDSAFKIVPLVDLSMQYRVLIHYRGQQPVFTATRYMIPGLYYLPFRHTQVSIPASPHSDTDELFTQTLDRNRLQIVAEVPVHYEENGYFISEIVNQRVAILSLDRVKNRTAYDSHLYMCTGRTIVDNIHNSGERDLTSTVKVRLVVYEPKQQIQIVERVDLIDQIPEPIKIYIVS